MTSMGWTGLLKSSILAFCQEFQHLKEPDTVLREELAEVEDHSKKRLQEFVRHATFGDVPRINQDLLGHGRYMRELELAYMASRPQRLNVYIEAMEELTGRMLKEQFNILGLATIQRLLPGLSISLNQDEDDATLLCPDDRQESASEFQSKTAAAEAAHAQATHHEVRWDDKSEQAVQPTASTAVTWCTLPRAGEADPDGNRGRERFHRAMPKRASLRHRTARNYRESSPSPIAAEVQVSYRQESADKDLILKRGQTLCNKAMKLGVDGLTTCILVFKNPIHGEWVSAGHIPEGETIPKLDDVVAEHMGPRRQPGASSHAVKVENGSPIAASGREPDCANMIIYNGIGCVD